MPYRALAFVALFVSACTVTTAPGGGTGEDGNGTPPTGSTARCVGKPVEAYTMRDRASCEAQGSDWGDTYLECRGTRSPVNCARTDGSSRPEEALRSACLDMPGCGFTEKDGTVTKPTGRCEGTKTPCSALQEAECNSQPGCFYYSTTKCTPRNGRYYLDNSDCANLQISNTVSFSVVRDACRRAKGCTWVE